MRNVDGQSRDPERLARLKRDPPLDGEPARQRVTGLGDEGGTLGVVHA